MVKSANCSCGHADERHGETGCQVRLAGPNTEGYWETCPCVKTVKFFERLRRYERDGFGALVGERLTSVTFVLDDYVQFSFDSAVLSAYSHPIIYVGSQVFKWGTSGYRDALCDAIKAEVMNASDDGEFLRLALNNKQGSKIIIPRQGENLPLETAELSDPVFQFCQVWRLGE